MSEGLQTDPGAWRRHLEALVPGFDVEVVASTGSTNSDLIERLRADAAAAPAQVRRSVESRAFAGTAPAAGEAGPPGWRPQLRVAERQTAGRGRHGRTWHSPPGGSLTFSLAWPSIAADLGGLSLAVGVAIADALDPLASGAAPRIGLKWPNDLWLLDPAPAAGRKLGGILIETVPCAGRRVAVIGIGLNVQGGSAPAGLSSGFASCDEVDSGATAPALLDRVLPALRSALQRFDAHGPAAFVDGYAARDLLAGRPVQTTAVPVLSGTAEGIDADGALRVRGLDGHVHRVTSGEISVRLQAAAGGASA